MNLTRVTITGADDSTDIQELVDLSAEFPFVEWAILVSQSSESSYRFPSSDWMRQFAGVASELHLNVSTHICGRWVRELLAGGLSVSDLPRIIYASKRCQINTHGQPHVSTIRMMEHLHVLQAAGIGEFIFQWDGVNDHLAFATAAYGYNASALFDTSAGAGILPSDWPNAPASIKCGYAGGLSPDNVVQQIEKIEKRCQQPYWIDMERRVRTEDDSALDMTKVRKVLELCRPLVR